ncbi:radical SAM family heme chaperone HemW [bacterium 210820-DFI.6.37]|nr:radical SAM family heme chaperone HemW [bacterium 210820-DFI.6.37]
MIINRPEKPAGLYIHIPFCLKKCGYCDFLSFGGSEEALRERYARALVRELSLNKERRSVDTIFIGGGTPSLLRADHIAEILKAARAAFSVQEDAEITIEANPKTLDQDKLRAYRKARINRLSIGAQSMDDQLLAFMGRAHSREDFLRNYRSARDAGFENINVDLMFGIPGQTRKAWRSSLSQIIGLAPEHISFYSLQLEEGTEFARMYRQGEMDLPPEEEDRAMYHEGIGMLKEAGYIHYEISNCARAGRECRHNLKYWSFDEYLAAGLGAHSFRYKQGRARNLSQLEAYLKAAEEGRLPVDEDAYERETEKDYMGEYVFTALRKMEGVSFSDFCATFGKDFFQVYSGSRKALMDYKARGLVELDETGFSLTARGIDISNEIMAEFV